MKDEKGAVNMTINELHLVKLSAENLVLRQRLSQLNKENKELRKTIENRNQIVDRVTIRIKGERND